ncbi:TRAP transporter substrate-binding protein [Bradyrhizobium sp. AUGA SZCCT0042]|uniref:TRAP transporter substrate-binding protein n=1 Tax=Bradyrhizobium sp. AUGA SZCCT0042 TaxID=2807651 RepID=UPI001BA61E3D|nr:TRAP transporter substrate-binding protein [Bradyrhizobium sp. AUGA SZCCT0042]MBR1297365.1 TRAP transporter substrate-binding protein [Bradyrhizobium sp. AUGA SZCCT0042]
MKRIVAPLFAAWFCSSALAEPVTLRLGAPAPARAHLNVRIFGPWSEKVTQASEGTLKIEFVPGGVLGTEGQLIERVKNGVVDIAYDIPGYYPGRFVKTEVVALPFLYDTSEQASLALWRLYEKGRISDEYTEIKTLGIVSVPNALFMSTVPLDKIEDLKGKKLQASTKLRTNLALTLGAIPVSVPVTDLYQSLSKGVVVAGVQQWTTVQPFRLGEVAAHFLEVPLGGSPMVFFMNKDRFDKLPPAAQKAIQDHSGERFVREFSQFWDQVNREGKNSIQSLPSKTIRTPSKEELEKWKSALAPVRETWIRDTPNGAEILKGYVEELVNVSK